MLRNFDPKTDSCGQAARAIHSPLWPMPFGIALLLAMALCLSSPPAMADEAPAGKVTALDGDAWVKKGFWGKKKLKVGSTIYTGDTLQTDDDSRINMRFLDKTFFTLGPDAKMKVDTFDESEDAEVGFSASILRGAFRFVSGLLSKKKPEAMNVSITTATIGVRGTHVAGEVFERVEENGVVVREASAVVTLLEDENGADTSILVSNQYGSVEVDEPGYGTEIPDEHSPPGPVRRVQLRNIENLMRVIRNTTRSSSPKLKLP
jgi:hypothetical protein